MNYSAANLTVSRVAAIIATCDWEPCSTSLPLWLTGASEPDFIVHDHGPIYSFRARSWAAQRWWADHIDRGPCLGRNCYVDHQYGQDILDRLQRDGFTPVSGMAQ